jgi:hypothetical protein
MNERELIMGLFDKFRSADIMGVRQYIEPGEHIFLITSNKCGPTKNPQAPKGQENFIAEFKVIKTVPMDDKQEKKLVEGMVCSLVETSNQQGYEGNVVSYVAGVLGMTPQEFQLDPASEQVLHDVTEEDQIFVGLLVRCSAQMVKTKKDKDYTAKLFQPVPAEAYASYGMVAPDGAYDGEWQQPLPDELVGDGSASNAA